MNAAPEIDRHAARDLLIKSKGYRLFSMIFAAFGGALFLGIYAVYYQGDPSQAVRDPMIVLFIIFPFIPAILMSMRAKKAEADLKKILTPPGK